MCNSSPENRYQIFEIGPNWTETGGTAPIVGSRRIVSRDVVRILISFYGENSGTQDETILALPHNWGNINRDTVSKWIQPTKMTVPIQIDLQMMESFYNPDDADRNPDDDVNEENDAAESD